MNRYKQQILLPEIGINGQKKIDNSKVLVVGAGGLGTIVASYLTAIGVGKIGIIDFDNIDETNLHRQFLYYPKDIGHIKANILSKRLIKQNENVEIISLNNKLDNSNANNLISQYQIVCDCSDNLDTRILLDKQCNINNIPLIHGAVSDWQGYITIFHYKNKFSYENLFEKKMFEKSQSCLNNGISSPICGIIGSYMVNETLKIILNIDTNLDGKLLYINSLKNITKVIKLNNSLQL